MTILNHLFRVSAIAAVSTVLGCAAGRTAHVEPTRADVLQPDHVITLGSAESELVEAFNASSDNVQLVLLLSPT